ncbi:hypothetical protein PHA51_09055 [Rodentibacter pneumotropicus]|uniref:hypothetical protein n=1 Tax=Rodentibacter pneumotropicus TaxID=758 RepID=UPI00232C5FB9|nr:hypothetical protein [Rodentibacter pneumotropicus]MDC2826173.1 hypothetical protein [Rodentibacter pneumotropicus]
MINKIALILFLFFSKNIYAENFCFSINDSNKILMISPDRDYLFYYPINKRINLKLKNREIFDDGGESKKVTFSESYYEIINRKKTDGIYTLITQSGKIDEVSYYNQFTKKKVIFNRIFGSNYQDSDISKRCY